MSPQIVIQDEAHAKRRRLVIAGAAACALTFAFALYALGRSQAPGDWARYQIDQQRADSGEKRLSQDNRRLINENRELSERVVALERAADVDTEADSDLRKALSDMQGQLAAANKELAFYRGIVSPEEAKAGVRVQQFTLRKTGEADVYGFNLVLIQSARHDKQVDGQVNLRMDGLRDGEAISLTWKDIGLDSKPQIVFSFKYFEEITGTFRVPANFDPTLIEIEIDPSSHNDDAFVDRYDWNELAGAKS